MNKSTMKTMFSSASENWATPRALAAALVKRYGIEIDVCATAENAVVPKFFSKEDDALNLPWRGRCWMNPPYGRTIGQWVMRAAEMNRIYDSKIVCLLPSRTDTKWWHAWIEPVRLGKRPGTVTFIQGRLHFNEAKAGAPFPSVIVVFGD
jgi:phage N-6-adenine-methyltransferase